MDKQCEFIHYYSNIRFGKFVQVFSYNLRSGHTGHNFFTNTGKFVQIRCNNSMFYVWKVDIVR